MTNTQREGKSAALAEELIEKVQKRIVCPLPLQSSVTSTPDTKEVVLTADQERVLAKVFGAHKLWCILGSAGTGKSVICHSIRDLCVKKELTCAMTSTTGLSSLGVGGNTVHSWSGAFAAVRDAEKEARRIRDNNSRALRNWQTTDLLVIDEVSMLRPQFLDVLDALGRVVKKVDAPFGGMRVVLVGDFFQLPPVSKTPEFVFQAKCFEYFECTVLSQVHRQKDHRLLNALDDLKTGNISDETNALFMARQSADVAQLADEDQPTLLYARCDMTEDANRVIVGQLETEGYVFRAQDKQYAVSVNGKVVKARKERWPVPEELELKVGCEVICRVNLKLSDGIATGSKGMVIGFIPAPPREGSVALSEFITSLGDLEEDALQEYLDRFDNKDNLVPVVRFGTRQGVVDWVICGKQFDQTYFRQVAFTRMQLPLNLGYALTVHKAQGQSLPFVQIDVTSFWKSHGLLYVALSRAVTLEGLFIEGFDRKKAVCDKAVLEFYDRINSKLTVV